MLRYQNGYALKAIEKTDLRRIADLRNDPTTWPYLHTLNFTNSIRQEEWWKKTSLDPTQSNFVFAHDDGFLGFVRITEIDHINKSVCVGGDLDVNARGKGLSKIMYDLIFDYVFNELNMNRAWLLVIDNNEKAISLYKSLGMSLQGTQRQALYRNGTYHDVYFFDILRIEYDKRFKV
jgi:RimJ/RimL family protein N-acetyltransferase